MYTLGLFSDRRDKSEWSTVTTARWSHLIENQIGFKKPSSDVNFRRFMDEDDDGAPTDLCRQSIGPNGELVYFRCTEIGNEVRITVQYDEPCREFAVLKSGRIANLLEKSFVECDKKLLTIEKQLDALNGRLVSLLLNIDKPPHYPNRILAAVSGTSPESNGIIFFSKIHEETTKFMEGLFAVSVDNILEMVPHNHYVSEVKRLIDGD